MIDYIYDDLPEDEKRMYMEREQKMLEREKRETRERLSNKGRFNGGMF